MKNFIKQSTSSDVWLVISKTHNVSWTALNKDDDDLVWSATVAGTYRTTRRATGHATGAVTRTVVWDYEKLHL